MTDQSYTPNAADPEGAPVKTVLQDFHGTVCSGCSRPKAPRMSHCHDCYKSLPKEMQHALWKRFGAGYEEAFRTSTAWIRERRPQQSLKF